MYKDILFPVDLAHADSWKKAIGIAVEYAERFGSKLHVLAVVSDSGMAIVSQYFSKDAADRVVSEAKEALHNFAKDNVPESVEVQHIVSTGNVYESIIETAKKVDADLIVMTAHRPELKDYLLGPNAARVVRHSDRSVLVVRD